MPIVKGTAPSGEKFDFYVPKGTTRKQGATLAERAYYRRLEGIDVTQPPPLPESTIGGEFLRGAESLASAFRTTAGAVLGDEEAAALAALERSEDIAQKYGEGPSFQAVREAEGILPTIGTALGQIPRAVAGQVPQLGATAAGAALGSFIPGVGTVIGGGLGALASLIPQFAGYNIERQAEADIAEGRPVDIDTGKAVGTAALQAVPELVGQYFVLGRGVVGKVIGKQLDEVGDAAKDAEKLITTANRSLGRTVGRGVATGAAAEMPTEVAQQVLERAQAGLDVLSDDALAEYGEAAYLAATIGGTFGPIGSVTGRAAARRRRDELAALTEETSAETTEEAEPLALPAPVTRVTPEGQAIPTEGIAPFEQERAAQEAISAVGAGTSPEIIQARQQAEERRAAAELEPQRELFPELVEVDAKLEAARAGTPTTLEDVDIVQGLGVPKASPVLKRIRGKDLSDPTQRAEVQEELTKYSKNGSVKPATRAKVKSFLASPTFVETEVQAPQQLTLEDAADTREIEELYAQDEQKELFAKQEAARARTEAAKTTVDATELEMNIGEADRRVAQTQQERTAQNRNAVLQPILERDDITSMDRLTRAFSAELGRQGFTNTEPTQDELAAITRRSYELDEEGTRAAVEAEQGAAGVAELEALIPEKGAKQTQRQPAAQPAAQPEAQETAAEKIQEPVSESAKQKEEPEVDLTDDFGDFEKDLEFEERRAEAARRAGRQRSADEETLSNTTAQYELDKEKFQQTFDEIKDNPGERASFLASIASDSISGSSEQKAAAQAKINEINENFSQDVKDDLVAAQNSIREDLGIPLPAEALAASAQALEPEVVELLREGKLSEALDILSQSKDKEIARVAKAVNAAILKDGGTKVTLESGLIGTNGKILAGTFDPKTNTIIINKDLTPTAHVLLHESLHAVTSHVVANSNDPITKQLQALFDNVKDRLEDSYGATSLDEFIAEAFSNPAFQAKLASMDTKGNKLPIWKQFVNAILNLVRRYRNIPFTKVTSARSEVDKLVTEIISPAPKYRNATRMNMEATAQEEGKFFNQAMGNFGGPVTESMVKTYNDTMPKLSSMGRRGILSSLPLNSIADYIKDSDDPNLRALGEELEQLFKLIQQKNGARQRNLGRVRDTAKQLDKVFKKLGEPQRELFNKVVMESTLRRADPSRPRSYYEKFRFSYIDQDGREVRDDGFTTKEARDAAVAELKAKDPQGNLTFAITDPSQGKLDNYDLVRKDYEKLADEAKTAYGTLRDAYAEAYTSLRMVIVERINAVDATTEEALFAKKSYRDQVLKELLNKESIEPYFPLFRKGDFWYNHIGFDPYTGNVEQFKVAFESPTERELYAKDVFEELRPEILNSEITTVVETREAARAKALAEGATPEQAEIAAVEAVIEGTNAERPTNERGQRSAVDINWAQSVIGKVITKKAEAAKKARAKAIEDGLSEAEADQIRDQTLRAGSAVENIVRDAMLEAMPERSLERSFRKRQNVRGAKMDAIDVFRQRMPAFLEQTESIRFDTPLTQRSNELKRKANAAVNTPNAEYAREIAEKGEQYIEFVKNPQISTYARTVKSLGFLMTLGFNVSSALVNSFILPVVVLPFLGGKYGYGATSAAMYRANKLYLGTGMRRRLNPFGGAPEGTEFDGPSLANLDPENLPEEYKQYKPLIEELIARGAANTSTVGDMLDIDNPTGNRFERGLTLFNGVSGFMFHQGERFNRQVTAMAAYDLAMAEQKKQNKGAEVTEEQQRKIIDQVMLDVEHTNSGALIETAPTLAQGNISSILLMYKRFGVSMVYLQMKMAKQALNRMFRTRKYSDKEVGDAKKQLIGLFGMSGLLAGAQGMPLYGVISTLANEIFLDEEDDDFDSIFASYIGEGAYSGALNAIFDVDVAPRIGMSNLLYRTLPNKEYENSLAYAAELFGGPMLGIAQRMERGRQLIADEEYQRGFESILPAGVSGPLKSIRYATKGATTLRGDPIVEDLSARSIFGQFFGFAPAGYTKQLEINARDKRVDRTINEKRTRLLRQRYVAYRVGDFEGVRDIDQEINEFNQRNPEVRITGDTKARSLRQHRITSQIARQLGGITISPRRLEKIIQKRLEETGERDFFL
jgi:hypothetical protein